MKERKLVAIPAEAHTAMFAFLANHKKQTGLKVTASSFLDYAIRITIQEGIMLKQEPVDV